MRISDADRDQIKCFYHVWLAGSVCTPFSMPMNPVHVLSVHSYNYPRAYTVTSKTERKGDTAFETRQSFLPYMYPFYPFRSLSAAQLFCLCIPPVKSDCLAARKTLISYLLNMHVIKSVSHCFSPAFGPVSDINIE